MTPDQAFALLMEIADLRADRDRLLQENAALRQHLADHPANQEETPNAD